MLSDAVAESFSPTSEEELSEILLDAIATKTRVHILGSGSSGLGASGAKFANGVTIESGKALVGPTMDRPADRYVNGSAVRSLFLCGMSKLDWYEPEELVLSAEAGMSLVNLEKLVDEQGQMLPHDPPDYSRLFEDHITSHNKDRDGEFSKGRRGTLGSSFSMNVSGPGRISTGSARDCLLGGVIFSGSAECLSFGGRVMKNVTGYDIAKFVCGSYGRLGALTRCIMKVVPKPEKRLTLVKTPIGPTEALVGFSELARRPLALSGAVHLPPHLLERILPDYATKARGRSSAADRNGIALVRVDAMEKDTTPRKTEVEACMGSGEWLDPMVSQKLWRAIRDLTFFDRRQDTRQLWRVHIPPRDAPGFVRAVRNFPELDCVIDWAGARLWLALAGGTTGCGHEIRRLLGSGHATLFRSCPRVHEELPSFQPRPSTLAALEERLFRAYDPHGIFGTSFSVQ